MDLNPPAAPIRGTRSPDWYSQTNQSSPIYLLKVGHLGGCMAQQACRR